VLEVSLQPEGAAALMLATVGHKQPTIKPDDLVRTPNGRTCLVLEILPGHLRRVEDCITGARAVWPVAQLYLVRAATPKRWAEHFLGPAVPIKKPA
jgi:hypothetical protein